MIFVLEYLGQEQFSLVVVLQRGNRGFLIHFEGDDQIGFQRSCKLARHNDRIPAERTLRSTGGFVSHDLAAAGVAGVDPQAFGFAFLPLSTCRSIPGHVFGRLSVQLRIISLKGFHFKL